MELLNVKNYLPSTDKWIQKPMLGIQKTGALRLGSGTVALLGIKGDEFILMAKEGDDYYIGKSQEKVEGCFMLRRLKKDFLVWYPRLGQEISKTYGVQLPCRLAISKTPNVVNGVSYYLIIKAPL